MELQLLIAVMVLCVGYLLGYVAAWGWRRARVRRRRPTAAPGRSSVFWVPFPAQLKARQVPVTDVGKGFCHVQFPVEGRARDLYTPEARVLYELPDGSLFVARPRENRRDAPWELRLQPRPHALVRVVAPSAPGPREVRS